MSLIEKMTEAMRDDPFIDDIPLLGTTQQDARMAHYAQAALTAIMGEGDGVQQCDREAAASGYFAWCSGNTTIPRKMRDGRADDHSMVQAFARHRSTAAAAERARMGWQSIETFPGDCPALLWGREAKDNDNEDYSDPDAWAAPQVHWLLYDYEDNRSPLGRRFVTDTYYNGDESVGCWPTHWMPLPAPPANAIERGDV